MPRRSSNWTLHETKNGWDLSKGGRYMYEGQPSRSACLARLKNHFKSGEQVFLEEVDGYRTNITQQLKKSGVI